MSLAPYPHRLGLGLIGTTHLGNQFRRITRCFVIIRTGGCGALCLRWWRTARDRSAQQIGGCRFLRLLRRALHTRCATLPILKKRHIILLRDPQPFGHILYGRRRILRTIRRKQIPLLYRGRKCLRR